MLVRGFTSVPRRSMKCERIFRFVIVVNLITKCFMFRYPNEKVELFYRHIPIDW